MDQSSPHLVHYLNDFSIVIQEFFQLWLETWMEKIGKTVFGIEHYTFKYEFAPGRGQIHGHLIGIMKDRSFWKTMYELQNDHSAQAQFLHQWTKGKVSYTAEVDVDIFDTESPSRDDNPCMEWFGNVIDKQKDQQ